MTSGQGGIEERDDRVRTICGVQSVLCTWVMSKTKTRSQMTYGDFQTPHDLARRVCVALQRDFWRPDVVIEPTCGTGGFLLAARQVFGEDTNLHGYDIRREAIEAARQVVPRCELVQADFFEVCWEEQVRQAPGRLAIVGNPPWVTNAEQGKLRAKNLPTKRNVQHRPGMEAITGHSNFDISEWMLLRLIEATHERPALLAMLVKTAVARNVLAWCWREGLPVRRSILRKVNARACFGVSVEAAALICELGEVGESRCTVFASLESTEPVATWGWVDDRWVWDLSAYERTKDLAGDGNEPWRSGIKHDCARILELRITADGLVNGLGEAVDVEDHVLFPLLKSADVANRRLNARRMLLLPERSINTSAVDIEKSAPRAWSYLCSNARYFDRRKSRVYRGRGRFSVFGVGDYSFSPWKIAISGLYKHLSFTLVPPLGGKPVLFDDTVYFLPCWSEEEASVKLRLLQTKEGTEFLLSQIFWDAKRPITARVLRRLSLVRLAARVGESAALEQLSRPVPTSGTGECS